MNIFKSSISSNLRFACRLSDGRLLISCHGQNRVLVAKEDGNVVGALDGVEFSSPEGIVVDKEGQILVVDRYNHCIHVFDSELTYKQRIGKGGQGPLEFNQPVGIAVSPVDGRVWVADNENHRVQAIDGNQFSASLGAGIGGAPGQLYCPCGVAVFIHPMHGELIVVSEWGGGRFQVFRPNGEVFAVFPGVPHAHHVAVEADGTIVVSEYATRKIKKFNIDGDSKELSASAVSIGADFFVVKDRILKASKGGGNKRSRKSI